MKKLTEKEKQQLKARIKADRAQKTEKEKKLIAHKHQSQKHSGVKSFLGGVFSMAGFFGRRRQKSANRRKMFDRALEDDQPLRQMKLTQAEKQALKKKIQQEQEKALDKG